jgi:hypothetical protein
MYSHTKENSHDEIIDKCDFGQRHLIGACISSTTTLFQSGESGELNALLDTSDSDGKNDDIPKQHKIHTYPTMLKLISGSLVGGANYNEIYLDPDDEDAFNSHSTNDSDTRKQEEDTKNVPTLPEIARKVAKLQKIQLDKKMIHFIQNDCLYISFGLSERWKRSAYKSRCIFTKKFGRINY